MPNKKIVIALDFDGLIVDSIRESFIQSVRTHKSMGGKVPESRAMEKRFRQGKPLTSGNDTYFTLMRLIAQRPLINFKKMTQEQFDAEFRREDSEKLKKFSALFSKNRKEMHKKNLKQWFALHKTFPGVKRWIQGLQRKNSVWITTGKDKESVLKLLERAGIKISENQILSRDIANGNKSKGELLRLVAERERVPIGNVLLIDDAMSYLKEAKEIGAEAALAKWGYSTRKQQRELRREGIPGIRRPLFGIGFTLSRKLKQMRKK